MVLNHRCDWQHEASVKLDVCPLTNKKICWAPNNNNHLSIPLPYLCLSCHVQTIKQSSVLMTILDFI